MKIIGLLLFLSILVSCSTTREKIDPRKISLEQSFPFDNTEINELVETLKLSATDSVTPALAREGINLERQTIQSSIFNMDLRFLSKGLIQYKEFNQFDLVVFDLGAKENFECVFSQKKPNLKKWSERIVKLYSSGNHYSSKIFQTDDIQFASPKNNVLKYREIVGIFGNNRSKGINQVTAHSLQIKVRNKQRYISCYSNELGFRKTVEKIIFDLEKQITEASQV